MNKEKGFMWAYLAVIIPVLGRYFYLWLIEGNLDFFLLALICISSVAFVVGGTCGKRNRRS